MKKNYFLTTFALLALMTFGIFTGCEKYSENIQPYELNELKLLEDFNAGKFEHDKGEYLKGSVSIYPIEDGVIDFYVNITDEKFIHYILQSEKPLTLQKKIENAEVLFLRRSVIINSLDTKDVILVTVDEDDAIGNSILNIPFDTKLKGYGLIRQNKTLSGQITSRASVSCGCCITGLSSSACSTTASGDCDSGGSGASSCSLTSGGDSCSVQCSSGNACCWDN